MMVKDGDESHGTIPIRKKSTKKHIQVNSNMKSQPLDIQSHLLRFGMTVPPKTYPSNAVHLRRYDWMSRV